MRTLLDTSVLIAGNLEAMAGELAISTVSIAEIHFGVLVARTDQQRAERLRLLAGIERTFDPLPVDDEVAASYGQLAAAVVRVGRTPRPRSLDLLIAATAHAHSARLATRNPDDLRGVDTLVEILALS